VIEINPVSDEDVDNNEHEVYESGRDEDEHDTKGGYKEDDPEKLCNHRQRQMEAHNFYASKC
jgi:hypothetical protein